MGEEERGRRRKEESVCVFVCKRVTNKTEDRKWLSPDKIDVFMSGI